MFQGGCELPLNWQCLMVWTSERSLGWLQGYLVEAVIQLLWDYRHIRTSVNSKFNRLSVQLQCDCPTILRLTLPNCTQKSRVNCFLIMVYIHTPNRVTHCCKVSRLLAFVAGFLLGWTLPLWMGWSFPTP